MIVSGEAAGERATASARVIVEQTNQMTALIRQLLDFSRHRGPRFGLVSVRAICARTVDMLSIMARRRHITLATELGDDPLLVSADEHQIQQALVNLLVNAMQTTPEGGRVEVTTGERRTRRPGDGTPEGDFVCLTVTDNGPGIPAENLPRLSSRSSPPRTRAKAPASASPSLRASCATTAAGSKSRARSASAVASPSGCRRWPRPSPPAPRRMSEPTPRARLLVVDDVQSMCEMLAERLPPLGFDVEWRTSAAEALAYLAAAEVDAVVTTSTCARWTAWSSATASSPPTPRCR